MVNNLCDECVCTKVCGEKSYYEWLRLNTSETENDELIDYVGWELCKR